MEMSRRTATIAGSIAALVAAGTLVAGPAIAKGGPLNDHAQNGLAHSQNDNGQGAGGGQGMGGGNGGVGGGMGNGNGGMGGGMGMGQAGEDHGMGMARGHLLHSEGTFSTTGPDGKTTYVTVREQSGRITAIDGNMITVTSDDDFAWTWTISDATKLIRRGANATLADLGTNEVVEVFGTVSSVTTGEAIVTTATANVVRVHAPRTIPAPPTPTTAPTPTA